MIACYDHDCVDPIGELQNHFELIVPIVFQLSDIPKIHARLKAVFLNLLFLNTYYILVSA
jgi:hypothetical protein